MYGTPTWRASRTCSRVCGIGPSAADDHQDRAVHLGGAGDHVLHEVGVARAVDVRVVAVLGLVLDVRRRDRHRLVRVTDRAALGDLRVALRLATELRGRTGRDSAAVSVLLPWSM
jgi:hypothetical protein